MRFTGELDVAIHTQQLTIAYSETLGDPAKTPILYLPGWGCTKEDIAGAEMNEDLADRRIISFDYPGYGDSPPPAEHPFPFNQWSYLGLVKTIHRRLDMGRTAVVGHSAAGADAIYFASFCKEYAAGLVSVMGNLGPADCFITGQLAGMTAQEVLHGGFDGYVLKLAQSKNPGMKRYVEQISNFDRAAILNYRNHGLSVVQHCELGNLLPRFLDYDGPKLFVHGEDEQTVYLDSLRAAPVPIATIEGAGHFPFVDKPAAYFKVLGDFMVQLDDGLRSQHA
ncbi:MAG TPA: alpha/beta fold hydrolase [Bacillota bacterium]|nr:alpha/beta fold hydrolase [Bacillota bacterium]